MSGDITTLSFYITTCSLFRLFGSAVSFLQCCNHFTSVDRASRAVRHRQTMLHWHGAGLLYNITCVCNRATRFRGDILLCGRAAHFPARGVNVLPAQLVTVPHDITSLTLWRASSLLLTHGSSVYQPSNILMKRRKIPRNVMVPLGVTCHFQDQLFNIYDTQGETKVWIHRVKALAAFSPSYYDSTSGIYYTLFKQLLYHHCYKHKYIVQNICLKTIVNKIK